MERRVGGIPTEDVEASFRSEYDRLNADVYRGALPPFPGVELADRSDVFSLTRARQFGATTVLRPFLVSTAVTGPLLRECILHEIAHAAALLFDADAGHGPAWQRHAKLVGASGDETLGPGHPLRRDWPRL